MLISIDGEERTELAGPGHTLGQLVEEARALLRPSGRVVVGIECDGVVLAPEQLDQALAGPADRYWQIDFHTAVPAELAASALEATNTLLEQIEGMNEAVASRLSQSQIREAMELMGKLFGSWNDAYRGIHNTMKLLGIDPESVETASGTAASAMNKVLQQLRQVKTALEGQDYAQLADILAYELGPLTKEWREVVDAVLDGLEQGGPTRRTDRPEQPEQP